MKSFDEFVKIITPDEKLFERANELYDTPFGILVTERYNSEYKLYQRQAAFTLALLERYHKWLDTGI